MILHILSAFQILKRLFPKCPDKALVSFYNHNFCYVITRIITTLTWLAAIPRGSDSKIQFQSDCSRE